MRLKVETRRLIGDAIDRGVKKTLVARVLGVTRAIVYKWNKRRKFLHDRKRKPKKRKVTLHIELSILALRNTLAWGTGRIQQGLMSLPGFVKSSFEKLRVKLVQGVTLSREAINNVLTKHKLNGYKNKPQGWKFFRAKSPNELWQLDMKGPFHLHGKKYYFVICIDDYSRYLLLAEQITHAPSIKEIGRMLEPLVKKHKPKKILIDNNPFKEEWDDWCKENNTKALHAHPYYPQDKGKVERNIRNIAEEFIYLLKKFPSWIKGKIKEYRYWFNHKRFHRGIKNYPARLYS